MRREARGLLCVPPTKSGAVDARRIPRNTAAGLATVGKILRRLSRTVITEAPDDAYWLGTPTGKKCPAFFISLPGTQGLF
jgi:hypothetical protein